MKKPTLLGVPYDASSSFMRGPAEAPAAIREEVWSDTRNTWCEAGIDLEGVLEDAGDVTIGDDPRGEIEAAVSSLLAAGATPIVLGGDHSITYPVLRAFRGQEFDVLHIDAHADLYDSLDGDRYSHACPFARSMEDGLIRRLVQVGVRTMNGHQQEQADRFGVEVIQMRDFSSGRRPELNAPVYVSIDIDGIDPAFAPGVSHYEPGGLSVRDVLDMVHALPGPIIGADVVEYNPHRDVQGMTANVAAKLVRELAGRMVTT
ncbi:MAG: agmatinase [Armatimonadetes bacterium]|nr:agmatinase [Armatimonadota bacterium]